MRSPTATGGTLGLQWLQLWACGGMRKGVDEFSYPLVMNAQPLVAQETINRALRLLEYQRRASRNYYDRNKEAIKARSVAYWEQNRDAINERRRQRYHLRHQAPEQNPELR
jgi:hypothetical protein